MSTRDEPERNSRMITSRVFWSMSPCVADTVKSFAFMLSVSQSTCARGTSVRPDSRCLTLCAMPKRAQRSV